MLESEKKFTHGKELEEDEKTRLFSPDDGRRGC